uniref:Uncharacterized protein n=1 Tax=Avena sativa TaxID=4498 RepID=A0ACD5UW32_AVESA
MTVVKRALPHLRDVLRSLMDSPAGVASLVPDQLCPLALEVAAELGVPGYIFCSSNLMALSTIIRAPELDKTTTGEFRDLPEMIRLPGLVPLHGSELVDTVQDRANQAYALVVELGKLYLLAQGLVVNTFDAMERETAVAWKELSDKGVYPPVYAVGPIIRQPCSSESSKHSSLRWLDDQPDGSVLYLCFGSGGTLSTEQTAELAAGLEASKQKFLWVVQFGNDSDKCGSYFGGGSRDEDNPVNYLPEGFVERTKGTGLAVPLWAPQVEILSHPAVGGFVSHCGWSSTLEAVAAGVPTIAWPLYAEQRMNAKMLSERAGMALRPKARVDGVATRGEVAAVARELMVGERGAFARNKVRELREEMGKCFVPDGSSRKALEAVAGSSCPLYFIRRRSISAVHIHVLSVNIPWLFRVNVNRRPSEQLRADLFPDAMTTRLAITIAACFGATVLMNSTHKTYKTQAKQNIRHTQPGTQATLTPECTLKTVASTLIYHENFCQTSTPPERNDIQR